MLLRIALCTLLIHSLFCFILIAASSGDRDPAYQACVSYCTSICPSVASLNPSTVQAHPQLAVQALPEPLTYSMRLFRWDCPEDCRYRCMRAHHFYTKAAGGATHKYFGKWPFIRVLGMQELFSVLFSIANLIPHAYYAYKYYHLQSIADYSLRRLWLVYGMIGINTWVWSAVFHSRDVLLTERLDYYCASLGIAYACAIGMIRMLNVRSSAGRFACIAVMMTGFLCHISYLQFVHFDYGWNMTVSLSLGLLYAGLWLCFAWIHRRSYCRHLIYSVFGLYLAASLEVFDFPPVLDLLDAHAAWHGMTPIIAIWFWKFVVEDSCYEVEVERKKAQYKQI